MSSKTQLHLSDVLAWTQGRLLNEHGHLIHDVVFDGVGSDTRKSMNGLLFVALKGDQFDAHQFLEQAVRAGAAGIFIHEVPQNFNAHQQQIPVILVPDTLIGLQELAKRYRRTCQAQFVGVTGSNGKTSTKEFAAAIVSSKKQTHSNKGSFNNHWGVPFNLLQVNPESEVVIVEMGMNHARELELLVGIADPDVVVCTMVGAAHIENFGTVENIARAKEEIYRFARADAKMIFNLDDRLTLEMHNKYSKERMGSQLYTFSEKETLASVQMKLEKMTLDSLQISGRVLDRMFQVQLPLFGKQNMTNLMAAACVALAVGLSPEEVIQGLPRCRTTWGRNQKLELKSGATLLFDAYNANPDSMKALLANLSMMDSASLVGVFGQMREIGAISAQAHQEIGELVGLLKMKSIFFIGDDFAAFQRGLLKTNPGAQNIYVQQQWDPQIQSAFEAAVKQEDLVVMKASRGTRLEQFLSDKMIDLKDLSYV